jgi:hypothetical protein
MFSIPDKKELNLSLHKNENDCTSSQQFVNEMLLYHLRIEKK